VAAAGKVSAASMRLIADAKGAVLVASPFAFLAIKSDCPDSITLNAKEGKKIYEGIGLSRS
jgi:hypothetical protein